MKFQGGPEEVLKMLQLMAESERENLLEIMIKKDPQLVDFLRNNLIRFDDLIHLTTSMIQNLLRDISPENLGLALRGSSRNLLEHFTANVSRNIKADILEIYNGAPKPINDVNQAREEIMKIVKEKIKKGEIVINPAGNEKYV